MKTRHNTAAQKYNMLLIFSKFELHLKETILVKINTVNILKVYLKSLSLTNFRLEVCRILSRIQSSRKHFERTQSTLEQNLQDFSYMSKCPHFFIKNLVSLGTLGTLPIEL